MYLISTHHFGGLLAFVDKRHFKIAQPSQTDMHPVQNWSLAMLPEPSAFLQTPAPILNKISGLMGSRTVFSTGLQFATVIERESNSSQHQHLIKSGLPNTYQGGINMCKSPRPRYVTNCWCRRPTSVQQFRAERAKHVLIESYGDHRLSALEGR